MDSLGGWDTPDKKSQRYCDAGQHKDFLDACLHQTKISAGQSMYITVPQHADITCLESVPQMRGMDPTWVSPHILKFEGINQLDLYKDRNKNKDGPTFRVS